MIIMPPNEIVKYIYFADGLPHPKEDMPEKYTESFQRYKMEYQKAKDMQKAEFEDIKNALNGANHS